MTSRKSASLLDQLTAVTGALLHIEQFYFCECGDNGCAVCEGAETQALGDLHCAMTGYRDALLRVHEQRNEMLRNLLGGRGGISVSWRDELRLYPIVGRVGCGEALSGRDRSFVTRLINRVASRQRRRRDAPHLSVI